MSIDRPPAVAGLFYSADPAQLASDVDGLLSLARLASAVTPKALIVPHAGYVYSGAIAASAYSTLRMAAHDVHRVVLLGPAHRVAFHGIAAPTASAFTTPLGAIQLDQPALAQIDSLPQVIRNDAAHALEHALEVQLPFLQRMLGDFTLVPLVVGSATEEEVAEVLEMLWGGPETLIVISSDLSHYLPYDLARRIDRQTTTDILALKPGIAHEQACGATPVNGFLHAARRHQLHGELLDLRNSGDTAGSRDQVVGYAACAFAPEPSHA